MPGKGQHAPKSAYESLLSLERSTADANAQLTEAALILGVDYETLNIEWSRDDFNQRGTRLIALVPQYEWILRWLAKRLRSDKDHSYSLDPRTWLLIRKVMETVPSRNIARIITDYYLLESIESTVHAASEQYSLISPFTSAVTGNFPQNTKNLKRKRSPELDCLPAPVNASRKGQEVLRVLETMFDGLIACLVLAEGDNLNVDLDTQSLRNALRANPDKAAFLVGQALMVGGIRMFPVDNPPDNLSPVGSKLWKLKVLISLWDFRDQNSSDLAHGASNTAFVKHCLSPALGVLKKLRGLTDFHSSDLAKRLQQLIAVHTILPIRSFSKPSRPLEVTPDHVQKADVAQSISTDLQSQWEPDCATSLESLVPLLPILLDTAIGALALSTAYRRQQESSWLQTFFLALWNLTEKCRPSHERDKHTEAQGSYLENLLRVLELRGIPLSTQILVDFAASPLCSLFEEQSTTNWTLLAQIIKLDVNVFLPNAGIKDSSKLLDALMTSLSSLTHFDSVHKYEIAVPLIEGFGRARDISTFLDRMYDQCAGRSRALLDAKDGNALGYSSATMWEDQDVLVALSSTLKDVVAPALMVSEFSRRFKTFTKHVTTNDNIKLRSMIIILSAFVATKSDLLSSPPTQSLLSEKLPSIAINILDQSRDDASAQMPLWQLLWDAGLTLQQQSVTFHAASSGRVSDLAVKTFSSALLPEQEVQVEKLTAGFFAFQVALLLAGSEAAKNLLQKAMLALNQSLLRISSIPNRPSCGLTVANIKSSLDLTVACTAAILSCPEKLLLVPQECLRYFQSLLQFADPENLDFQRNDSGESSLFPKLFRAFVVHERVLQEDQLLGNLSQALITQTESRGAITDFVAWVLSELPLNTLSRRRRAQLCDKIFDNSKKSVRSSHGQNPQRLSVRLDLLIKLVKSADNSAKILSDAKTLWATMSKYSYSDCNSWMDEELYIGQYRDLSDSVWKRVIVSSERRQGFIQTYLNLVSSSMEKPALQHTQQSPPYWELVHSFLNLLKEHENLVVEANIETQLYDTIDRWSALLIEKLGYLTVAAQEADDLEAIYYPLCWTLNALVTFQDRFSDNAQLKKSIRKMEKIFASVNKPQIMAERISLQIRSFQRKIKHKKKPDANGEDPYLQKLIDDILAASSTNGELGSTSKEDLYHQSSVIYRLVRSLSQNELRQLVSIFNDQTKYKKVQNQRNLVVIVMATVRGLGHISSRNADEAQLFISLIANLQESLKSAHTVESFVLTCDCITSLIKNQPKLVIQYIFDTILGTVALCASPAGPEFGPNNSESTASVIYTRLTTLTTILLSHYRKKLGGRFHLLLPVLQNLLRCLFIPHRPSAESSTASSQPPTFQPLTSMHPPWLPSSSSSSSTPISPSSATSLTRLLTTLTDPTPTSLRSTPHPHRTGTSKPPSLTLTDPIPRARRIASQYLQYLIIEYCSCRLRGRLDPDVKTALQPGLFAILEIMDEETRRGMNGEMGRQLREVFRGLWAEWGVWRGRVPGG